MFILTANSLMVSFSSVDQTRKEQAGDWIEMDWTAKVMIIIGDCKGG